MSKSKELIEKTLEDLVECFIDQGGDGYTIETDVGDLVRVSSEVETLVDRANYVLYEDGEDDDFREPTD